MGETNNDNIIYIDHIGLHRKDVKINKNKKKSNENIGEKDMIPVQ